MNKADSIAAKNDLPKTEANGAEVPALTVDSGLGESDALSTMRHSLRTPLNQIIGYSELLMEQAEGAEEVFLPDLHKIHTAGRQLLALVNDGLAPWKIETGKIDLEVMRQEMRTPLNLIIGYSELCQDVADDLIMEKLKADLQKITAAARNLIALFDSKSFPSQLEILNYATKPGASASTMLGLGESAPGPGHGHLQQGEILIVDDNEMNRDMLCRRLEREGYTITEVENGRQALEIVKTKKFDLILLDVLMPELNGYDTLTQLKANKLFAHIPVIMISAMDEIESTVKCIEIGAEDYLPKPFNAVLLKARITTSLEKKRLRDREQQFVAQLQVEREKSERLLLNLMPKPIVDRMRSGEVNIADSFSEATVLSADCVGFNQLNDDFVPLHMVQLMNDIYSGFDWLVDIYGLVKIKSFGDKYMVVGGVPMSRPDHASAVADMALEMLRVTGRFNARNKVEFHIRIGISTGPVKAGIVGRKSFFYHLWGEAVETAMQMESLGAPDSIMMAPTTFERLSNQYLFEERSPMEIKHQGWGNPYLLTGRI